jgi:serine/threonine protein kinase
MIADNHVLSPATCPDPRRLLAFGVGDLPLEEREIIAEHVQHCARCLAALDAMEPADDPLIQALRHAASAEASSEVGTERLLAGVDALAELTSASAAGPEGRAARNPTRIPRQLGDCVLEEPLGQGGMGTVFRARHRRLNKVVAIKVIADHRVNDPRSIGRFRREMKILGSLNHPHIIQAFDAREEEGILFLTMEYLDGRDLASLVGRCGGLRIPDACEVIRQAAVGLHFAHYKRDLVHRDIKPSNLMVTRDGCVKILDLGLALLSSTSDETLTLDGDIIGSPDYMAPEQWLGSHSVDRRADLYSLGCTLYHILAGVPPFTAPVYDTRGKKMMAHAHEQPGPIRERRHDVPEELVAILARLMAKDPAQRYATAAAVADALQPLTAGHDLPSLLSRTGLDAAMAGNREIVIAESTAVLPERPVDEVVEDLRGREPWWPRLGRDLRTWLIIAVGSAVVVLLLAVALWRSGMPGSLDRSPSVSVHPRGMVTEPRATPIPEISVTFRARAYRFDDQEKDAPQDMGELGRSVSVPRTGDRLVISAEFGQPVYPYLVAVNPDGSWQQLDPAPEGPTSPKPTTSFRHPLGNDYLTLEDPGFSALVVLVASKPLPPDAVSPPGIDKDAWRSTSVQVPWLHDGYRCDPLVKERIGTAEHGPRPFVELCQSLASRQAIVKLRAIAFSVAKAVAHGGGDADTVQLRARLVRQARRRIYQIGD